MSTTGIQGGSGLITPVSINTSGGLTGGSTLTNSGAGGRLQLTGLASGINTTELIQAELAQREMPLENMQAEVSALNTENNTLSAIQTSLQTVSFDAEMMGEPSLFFPVQNINSSDSSLITATTTNGPGAPIGSTTLTVTALASAAESVYSWTAPASADTMTIQVGTGASQTVSIAAGATAEQAAETINGDSSLGVYATVETGSSGATELVLSSAATGAGNLVNAVDSQSSLGAVGTTEVDTSPETVNSNGTVTPSTASTWAVPVSQADGTDAQYYLNGSSTASYSASDTVTNAIPGVTLTLLGVTGTSPTTNPVTITADAPAPNKSAIVQAVQQFVSDYNKALDALNADINTAPASESTPSDYSPYSGSLFGDDELEQLMAEMRTSVMQDATGAGVQASLNNLTQIGITGTDMSGNVTSGGVEGHLSVNTTALAAAIQSNPNGVEALLSSFSQSFQTMINNTAGPAGALNERVQGNDSIIANLNGQLSTQEALYQQEEKNMEEQWAQVESTLADLHNQKTSLAAFAGSLGTSSSSSAG